MKEKVDIMDKPDLPKPLFWEFRYDDIEWRQEYRTVIARVIERGTPEHWTEIIRYYGESFVMNAIKNEIVFLPDYAIDEVCAYFSLDRDELFCYRRKQSKLGHWI
ncbi:hypothetical protein QEG73_00860 [Chitinophagaceae bacterium 26-R-25]|nr:hypothetical protein [Chitinophagaceae bacterium 26-R-25]